jgi:dTDP-4-amino-4,6-dideoxygalactose transaminase
LRNAAPASIRTPDGRRLLTKTRIDIAHPSLGDEEWQALREPIESGWLTQGPKVQAFEAAFAERHQVGHALATTSCTTALHLALAALGTGPGDEVIVPSFTWVATANVVIYCGATPVLVDVEPETFNIDPAAVAAAVTERTRAVIPVHLFGLCANMDALRAALPETVKIVEDAACAAGASHDGTPAGGLGDAAAFSFHPRKSITTGEGGMLTTNDAELSERAAAMRNHGAAIPEEVRVHGPKPYLLPDFDVLGFNYRMTDLQGAVGLVQLSKLDAFIIERARWAAWYRDRLGGLSWLHLPEEPAGGRHAWQTFVARIDPQSAPMPRNEIMERLEAEGISTRPGTHAVHRLGYYRDRFGFDDESFPVSRALADTTLALPLHNRMTEADFVRVADALLNL